MKFILSASKLFVVFFVMLSFNSCFTERKVAYFADLKDSTVISAKDAFEPVIQKKDILSISVSSLSPDANAIFNAPNLPIMPYGSASNSAQTAGYLVGQEGTIKFTMLGDVQAAGLNQKQLENNIAKLLVDKKLLFDPIVTVRFLNFRVTVLGEVTRPGVISVPSEQISVLEAIGQAGDLTIFGIRENVMLIRQEGDEKIIRRLNLNSSQLLQSPYFFLKSNDVLYVEPSKARIASAAQARQTLPIIFSGLSLLVIILNSILN